MPRVEAGPPLISVIIPAYNHEQFIAAAVDSVLQQTITDLELIVVDDGSTDRTGEIVKQYGDSRISYYHQENQDAYNTINRGMSLAKGKFVAILNSDDVYSLDRFERMLLYWEKTAAQCIISDVIPISDNGVEFSDPGFGWNIWHQKNRKFYFECGDIYTAFLKGNFMVTTSNLFMTREALVEVGNFCSLRYLHDYDYIFRLMLRYPTGVHYLADEKLLYYRIHSGNTLGEAAVVGRKQDQELITKYLTARIPEEYRMSVLAGSERLIELGNELHEVRAELDHLEFMGVRSATKNLMYSLRRWFNKKVRQ